MYILKCFICSAEIKKGYLCKKHADELYEMLVNKKNIVSNPDWRYHCQLCGEFQNRIIIEYPSQGPFCDKDIIEEWESYHKGNKSS